MNVWLYGSLISEKTGSKINSFSVCRQTAASFNKTRFVPGEDESQRAAPSGAS